MESSVTPLNHITFHSSAAEKARVCGVHRQSGTEGGTEKNVRSVTQWSASEGVCAWVSVCVQQGKVAGVYRVR